MRPDHRSRSCTARARRQHGGDIRIDSGCKCFFAGLVIVSIASPGPREGGIFCTDIVHFGKWRTNQSSTDSQLTEFFFRTTRNENAIIPSWWWVGLLDVARVVRKSW